MRELFSILKKILTVVAIIIFAIGLFIVITIMIYTHDDKSDCLSGGICKEGLELNTEYGKVLINKENCLKYNWKWNEERKWCDVDD